MKPKEIQELITFLSESGLEEVNIETGDFKVSIKRSTEQQVIAGSVPPVPVLGTVAPPAVVATPSDTPQQVNPATSENPSIESTSSSNLLEVKSPMIGTFYRSSNPDTPVFVEVGSTVKVGDTICIIEAMKLFNEIESEVSGKIVKILVDNAQPVEFDQPLFLVDPS